MAEAFPAKSVSVIKLFVALCNVPGCRYVGESRADYQAANADRQLHLASHRRAVEFAEAHDGA